MSLLSARKVQEFSRTAADTGVKAIQAQSHFVVESLKRSNTTIAELTDARLDTLYEGLTAGSVKEFRAHNAAFRATARHKLKDLYGSNKESLQSLSSELKSIYGLDRLNTDSFDGVVKKITDTGISLKSALSPITGPRANPKAKRKPSTRKAAPRKAASATKKAAPRKAAPRKAAPVTRVSPAADTRSSS